MKIFTQTNDAKELKQKYKSLKQDWATLSTDDKLLKMRRLFGRMLEASE